MTLRTRLLITGAAASLPLAYLVTSRAGSLRTADMTATLEHVVKLQINDQVRERCESDPQWFLTGPLEGRPKIGTPKSTDPDVIAPRAKPTELPFELYAYDEQFTGSSTAAPRFPATIKTALRSGSGSKIEPFDTPDGEGAQIGILTGWTGGPCTVWLGRMRPDPARVGSQTWLFAEATLLFFGTIVLAGWPLAERVRRSAAVARQSARSDYDVIVPASGRDEFTGIIAALNEAGADVRRRIADVKDREEAHRRFIARAADEIVPPLEVLESELGDAAAIRKTHDIAAHAANLVAGARLRMRSGLTAQDDVDLRGVVTRVSERHAVLARANQVTVETSVPNEPVVIVGDAAMFDRALGNLVENAIENNRPGGHVNIRLAVTDPGKFSLRVIDDGRGMSDEQLTHLMAVRRFRGDEGKGSPGKRGLGLALVWEVAERSQLQVAIRQASGKGVAVEISGKTKSF